MKELLKKINGVLKTIFGYGIMVCLFAGGMTFFGYVAALIIGGDAAAIICEVIYKRIIPVIIYASNILVVLGLITLYLSGEKALTTDKKRFLSIREKCNAGISITICHKGLLSV